MLQRYVVRDRIAIESVSMTPEVKRYSPPPAAWVQINKPPQFCGNVGSQFFGLGPLPPDPMGQTGVVRYLGWLDAQIAFFESISSSVDEFKNALTREPPPTPHLSWRKATSLGVCMTPSTPDSWREPLVHDLENASSEIADFVSDLREERQRAAGFAFERTGRVSVHVTVLNRGDTDGLIERVGALRWGTESKLVLVLEADRKGEGSQVSPSPFWRPFSETEDGAVTPATIPRRAATQLTFLIDESNTSQGQLAQFVEAVRKKQLITYSVEVSDFRGDVYRSQPVDISLL